MNENENTTEAKAMPPASAGSVASEPLGWAVINQGVAVRFAGSFLTLANIATQNEEIIPLYRHPQPTLTDAEREALEWCAEAQRSGAKRAATLRGLLARLK